MFVYFLRKVNLNLAEPIQGEPESGLDHASVAPVRGGDEHPVIPEHAEVLHGPDALLEFVLYNLQLVLYKSQNHRVDRLAPQVHIVFALTGDRYYLGCCWDPHPNLIQVWLL